MLVSWNNNNLIAGHLTGGLNAPPSLEFIANLASSPCKKDSARRPNIDQFLESIRFFKIYQSVNFKQFLFIRIRTRSTRKIQQRSSPLRRSLPSCAAATWNRRNGIAKAQSLGGRRCAGEGSGTAWIASSPAELLGVCQSDAVYFHVWEAYENWREFRNWGMSCPALCYCELRPVNIQES